MSRHYTVRPNHVVELGARVAKIEPLGTPVLVTGKDMEPKEVTADEIFDAGGAVGLRLSAMSSAGVLVTYADEAEAA